MKYLIFILTTLSLPVKLYSQLDWQEIQIPMSDGQFLAADIYLPETCTQCPVILIQTPYNKNLFHFGLPLQVGWNQAESNYAFVILDWRGRFGSADAAYQGAPSTGEDGYDAVEWIADQDWCDGNIGTWGPSALGRVQFSTAKQNPTALKCICPLVAGPQQNYSEYYPGGCLRTEYVEQLDVLGFGLSPLVIGNPYYNFTWQIAEDLNFYPSEIHVPVLMIGGWYDHNVESMIDFFTALQSEAPAEVLGKQWLVMGPWAHGGSGTASVGDSMQGELEYANAAGWNNDMAMAFFDHYLRGIENNWEENPSVNYYQMGENQFYDSSAWPPNGTETTNLYLHQNQLLESEMPDANETSLSFTYDPTDPSPTVGGPTLLNELEQGPYDQAPEVESRNDILVFTSDVIGQPVVVKGEPRVFLTVSSDKVDTDFAVRLCDVYPDGRSMIVCDGIFRMRFKNGFGEADESFMIENEMYACVVELPNTAITFLEGHRIRLDVSSSNYPRFNRNMNTGEEMYPNMNGDTLINALIATNTIHLSEVNPSYLQLPLQLAVSVSEHQGIDALHVYPNPADDFIYVESNSSELIEIILTDLTGRILVSEFTTENITRISIENISSGLYTLISKSKNGTAHTHKVCVN